MLFAVVYSCTETIVWKEKQIPLNNAHCEVHYRK